MKSGTTEVLMVAGIIVVGYVVVTGILKFQQTTLDAVGNVENGVSNSINNVTSSVGQIGSDILYGAAIGIPLLLLL